jgi:8-oxo-dGTP diphosphatase
MSTHPTMTQHHAPRPDARAPDADRLTRVGVGVLVFRAGRVLLGQRLGSHGAGSWAPPGGHLEFGESAERCARRELFEETGLTLGALQPAPYTVDAFPEIGRHYVTLFVVATDSAGEPERREPTKCARWEWFDWSALPAPLFAPLASLCAQGFTPPPAGPTASTIRR